MPAANPFESETAEGVQRLPSVPSSRLTNIVFFVALLTSALVLGPALAHVMELPNKIGLPRDEYFIVQKAYRGWSQIGWLLVLQVAALVTAAALARAERRVQLLTLLALACVASAQGLFWTLTWPANVATANWTVAPDNWDRLRLQWEASHAMGALLQVAGLCLLIGAALSRGHRHLLRSYYY